MEIVVWMLAGGILGWIGYKFLNFNEGRGMMVSMIIGAVGGFFGGKIVAPMFTAPAAIPADLSTSAVIFAVAVAAVFLYAGNFVHDRWGV